VEKAVLKTLIYSDIFDYPLKAWEIHKWLIGKKASLREVENTLKRLEKKEKISSKGGYYFLPKRDSLVKKRRERQLSSTSLLRKLGLILRLLKWVPFIKLIGLSGSLSLENAKKGDDIDLFIIIQRGRLWACRLLLFLLVNFLGVGRRRAEKSLMVGGKICINILLEEPSLGQDDGNIYIAHEVLQMIPLFQRDHIYTSYLLENSWAFDYLPNWTTGLSVGSQDKAKKLNLVKKSSLNSKKLNVSWFDYFEKIAKWLQLRYMGKPTGKERILERALYFLPDDRAQDILNLYKKGLKKYHL
jgi:hypothetical protein